MRAQGLGLLYNNNYDHKANSVRDLLKLWYLAKLYSMVYIYFYECPKNCLKKCCEESCFVSDMNNEEN